MAFLKLKLKLSTTLNPDLHQLAASSVQRVRSRLPVPAGFTITTEVCTYYYDHNRTYPASLDRQIDDAIAKLEHAMGRKFGDSSNPLLVAVRSGARDSMPGMMDTILNLGLNDRTVRALAERSKNERFAYDCYRRFLQMYGDVVMGVQKRPGEDHEPFETVIEGLKAELFPKDPHVSDTKLDAAALRTLTDRFRN